jgi:two-component system chemotaxis response regulator CheY
MASSNAHPRLLLVDDSRVTLRLLRKYLRESEFEVAGEATSGSEALELYPEVSPDIVLLDIVMPELDGVETLRRLLEMDGQARVVMVSSLGTREKVLECMELGARSFLSKPYETEKLLQVLRRTLQEATA